MEYKPILIGAVIGAIILAIQYLSSFGTQGIITGLIMGLILGALFGLIYQKSERKIRPIGAIIGGIFFLIWEFFEVFLPFSLPDIWLSTLFNGIIGLIGGDLGEGIGYILILPYGIIISGLYGYLIGWLIEYLKYKEMKSWVVMGGLLGAIILAIRTSSYQSAQATIASLIIGLILGGLFGLIYQKSKIKIKPIGAIIGGIFAILVGGYFGNPDSTFLYYLLLFPFFNSVIELIGGDLGNSMYFFLSLPYAIIIGTIYGYLIGWLIEYLKYKK